MDSNQSDDDNQNNYINNPAGNGSSTNKNYDPQQNYFDNFYNDHNHNANNDDPQNFLHSNVNNYNNDHHQQQQQQHFQEYYYDNDNGNNNNGQKSNKNNMVNSHSSKRLNTEDAQNYFQQNMIEQAQNNNNMMMEIDLSQSDANYFQDDQQHDFHYDDSSKSSKIVDDGLSSLQNDNIFESKKNLHDYAASKHHPQSRQPQQQQLGTTTTFMDASQDDEVNKRVEGVLKSFNKQQDDSNSLKKSNKNNIANIKTNLSNNINHQQQQHQQMALTLDASPNNNLMPDTNIQYKEEDLDNRGGINTIQHSDGAHNMLKVMYESQDIEARNNYINDNNDLENDSAANQYGNIINKNADGKLKLNQNIDMKMFGKKSGNQTGKKSLKKGFKGINMQDTDNIQVEMDPTHHQQNRNGPMDDTYQAPKKGKIKKDREQEIVIDDNNNNQLNDDAGSNLGRENSGLGGAGIEFYNRSPRVGYETNEDNDNDNQKHAPDANISLERDENDNDQQQQDDGDDDLKAPQHALKTTGGKKLNKKKILKNKANKDYLEQLKTMNNISNNNKDGDNNDNNAYQDDEPDDYTKEYLRQKKSKQPQKSSRMFGNTLTGDVNSATQQYGLQQVKVAQVLETTRKTQRSNRTHRGNESTISHRDNYQKDAMNDKSFGKNNSMLMGTINNNKFSIGEVEYKDQEYDNSLNNSRRDAGQLGFDNSIQRKNDIGGGAPLADYEMRDVNYKDKLRQLREKSIHRKQQRGTDIGNGDDISDEEGLDDSQINQRQQLQVQDESLLGNQVNNSYFVTNENQRILESEQDEEEDQHLRRSDDDPRASKVPFNKNNADFQDVNLGKSLELSNSRKMSNKSLAESLKLSNNSPNSKGNSQQFDRLHYDLSKAINDAKLNESQSQLNTTIVPFKREQFRALILNTYDDWYSDISIKWDINDYMEVVDKSQLEEHFSKYLEINGFNTLTLTNMPFVDLGQKPSTYNPRKPEAEQIYIIPSSTYPTKLIVKYADCKPLFGLRFLEDKYKKSKLEERGVSFEELQSSLLNASIYLRPYRGAVTRLDRINLINILVGLAVTIALSMSIGISIHWAFSLIFIVVYFIFAAISIRLTKQKSNRFLRQAHFMLAVYCRAENNRYFLKKNIEVRPGFLGRWIEFNIHNVRQQQQQQQMPDQENQVNNINNNQNDGDQNIQQQENNENGAVVIDGSNSFDLTSKEYIEQMRERWEKQKNMKQINLFLGKGAKERSGPIPIKDIEQYKQDQQLAMLLQEQESGKYQDQHQEFYEDQDNEEYKEHTDFEAAHGFTNNLKNGDNLRRILPPVHEMGGALTNNNIGGLNEDHIYSGLYDKSHSKNPKNRLPPILPKTYNSNKNIIGNYGMHSQQNQFRSPDGRSGTNHHGGFQNNDSDPDNYYNEEGQSVQSSMKKLTRSYYNMAAVPPQQNANNYIIARKASNMINPVRSHLQSEDQSSGGGNGGQYANGGGKKYSNDYGEEIKEEDDADFQDDNHQHHHNANGDADEYDDEVDNNDGNDIGGPQNYYPHHPQQQQQQKQQAHSNNNKIINVQKTSTQIINGKHQSQQHQQSPPKPKKKFQEESYHMDDGDFDDDDDDDDY